MGTGFVDLKTESSERELDLDPWTMNLFEAYFNVPLQIYLALSFSIRILNHALLVTSVKRSPCEIEYRPYHSPWITTYEYFHLVIRRGQYTLCIKTRRSL